MTRIWFDKRFKHTGSPQTSSIENGPDWHVISYANPGPFKKTQDFETIKEK
jgi:hypothetical protein